MIMMGWTRIFSRQVVLVALMAFLCQTALAAPVPVIPAPMIFSSQTPATAAYVDKVRVSPDDAVFRLVFDMTAIPAYTLNLVDSPLQVEVELPDTVNRGGVGQLSFNDPFVENLRFVDLGGGRVKAVIALKLPVLPKISSMSNPTRLVLDLQKSYDSQTESVVAPGVVYREFIKGRSEGPVKAHLLEVDLKSGYTLQPVLSNDSVIGIETLSEMAERINGVAIINGPYFMRNGEIIGLLKIDRTLVSTPDTPRTSVGVMPDGKLIFDAPAFSGYVELPDKTKIPIDAINRGRGVSELILYNPYYAFWTLTSGDNGMEYVVRGDRVVEIRESNSRIPDGVVVLSASGRTAWQMSDLKVGSQVKIVQTLGPVWDNVVHAVGGGPCLVKNGEIYVTTLGEEFGSDVAGGRAPRTAIGMTKDGKALLLVVDGRRRTSVGFSLLELAQFMLELGAVDAMNLDGGGSSQMIVGSHTVNVPSDGRERRLGAGIAVIKTKQVK